MNRGGERKTVAELVLSLPTLVWLVLFMVIPALVVLAFSFRGADPYGGIGPAWTLESIRSLGNPNYPDIIWRTLRSGLGLTLGGLIVGVPPAVYALRLAAREELVAKGPFPSASLATAVFAVALAALLAALLPALRAASVDPARALRRD